MQVALIRRCPVPAPVGSLALPVPGIVFPMGHIGVVAAFGLNEMLFRCGVMGCFKKFREPLPGAFIPVNGQSAEIAGVLFVRVHFSRPFGDTCTVLIVSQNLHSPESCRLESGPKDVAHECGFLGRREGHTLPVTAVAVGLVYRGKPPYINAFILVSLEVAHEIIGIELPVFARQTAVDPRTVVLHPPRCRPGRRHYRKSVLRDSLCILY